MKSQYLIAATLFQIYAVSASDEFAGLPVRIHPRSLAKRDGRNCGSFTMFCDKAAGACNNACYHINCVDKGSKTMYFDPGDNNNKNRLHSGCETNDKSPGASVCNKLPMSQKVHDWQNRDPGDITFNCDEWPMANLKQADYKDGTWRNTLRCIPRGENSSGGGQLKAWMDGTNKQGPKKKDECKDFKDGDYWTVDFDTNGVDDSKVNHCKNPGKECDDPNAFHMTKKTEKLEQPYDADKHNRYALGKETDFVSQCSVVLDLHGYEATASARDNKQKIVDTKSGRLEKSGSQFTLKGLPLDLVVLKSTEDDGGASFNYGAAEFVDFNLEKDFFFSLNSKGTSKQINADGSYCEKSQQQGTEQVFTCYFPCEQKP